MDPEERKELLEIIHDATWSASQGWDKPYDRNEGSGLFGLVVGGVCAYYMVKTLTIITLD